MYDVFFFCRTFLLHSSPSSSPKIERERVMMTFGKAWVNVGWKEERNVWTAIYSDKWMEFPAGDSVRKRWMGGMRSGNKVAVTSPIPTDGRTKRKEAKRPDTDGCNWK